jgi:hypothetical protein
LKLRTLILSILFIAALGGCTSKPLPPDKQDCIGQWRSEHVYLQITADGFVHYRYQKGTMSREINAPLKHFEGDDFVVGVGFLTTTFEVSKPPYQDGLDWKIVVDEVELHRLIKKVYM